MKPVCVPCERFMRAKKTGFYFVEGMPKGDGKAPPGKAAPEKWGPYKLWSGDLFECPDCHAKTIVGVGFKPIAEHYEPSFERAVERYGATLLVKDC